MKNRNAAPSTPLAALTRPWLLCSLALVLGACSTTPSVPSEPQAGGPAEYTEAPAGRLTELAITTGDNILSKEAWTAATNGWGPAERNVSNGEAGRGDGRTITLNGKTYPTGFGVHANSSLTFAIGGLCSALTADIGVDDEVGDRGSVTFQVYGDGVKLYDSGVMTGVSATKSINVNITGKKELKLVVTNGGDNLDYDHADWAGAILKCGPAATPALAPVPVVPGRPLIITKGGTYTGSWQSDDFNVPAVQVNTSEPVTLENCTVRGRGNLIESSWKNANLTVRNCQGYGLNPNVPTRFPGRFLTVEGVSSLLVENNYLEKTSGMYVNTWTGDASRPLTVTIRQNRARNIEGRYSDGNGGYQSNSYPVQFVQINNLNSVPRVEIAWNRVDNTPGESRVEDTINLHDSMGTPDSPIRVRDNLINGAYGTPASGSYSGGGIMLGDGCRSGYSEASGNTVIETSNYGIAVANGNYQSVLNNTILGLGKLSDGTLLDADSDAGLYLRDYCQDPAHKGSTVVARGNTVGWGIPTATNPNARWDWSIGGSVGGPAGTQSGNTQVQAYNRAVDSLLLTQAITAWEQRASAAGVVVGLR